MRTKAIVGLITSVIVLAATANAAMLIAGNTDGSIRQIDTSIPNDTPLYNILPFGATGLAVDDTNGILYASGGGGNWAQIAIFDLATGADLTGQRFSSEYHELYGLEFVRMPDGSGRLFSVGTLNNQPYFIEYELGGDGLPSAVKSAFQIAPSGNMNGLAYVPERDRFYSNQSGNMFWEIDLNTRTSQALWGLAMSATSGLGYQDGKLYGLAAGGTNALVYFDLDAVPPAPHQILVATSSQVANGWALTGSTTPALPVPTGACCFSDQSCEVMTAAACAAVSGVYRGDNTTCTPNPCLQPMGACCFPDGSCQLMTAADCAATSGAYRGDDTNCTPNLCPQPTGACCFPDGSCQVMTAAPCAAASGAYQGDDTTCTPNPCPQPTGACCFPDDSCQVMTAAECTSASGRYRGNDSTCTPNPCMSAILIAGNTDGNIRRVDTSIPGESPMYNIGFGATGLAVDNASGILYASGGGGDWAQIAVFDLATGADLTGQRFSSEYHELYGLEFVRVPGGGGGRLCSVGTLDGQAYFIEYELGGPCGLPSAVKSAFQILDGDNQPPLMNGLAYVPQRDRFYSNQAGNTFWEIDGGTSTSRALWGLGLSGTNGLAYQDGKLYGLSAGHVASLVYFDLDNAPHQIEVADNSQVANGWALSGSTTPVLTSPAVCCRAGVCTIEREEECVATGGTWYGRWNDCTGRCSIVSGACCFVDGHCEAPVLNDDCAIRGGQFQGEGTTCDPNPCAQPGACCREACGQVVCEYIPEWSCTARGGTFIGVGVLCETSPCPGACCYLDQSCQDSTIGQCAQTDGLFMGLFTQCATTLCPAPGACCTGTGCIETLPSFCEAAGGTFAGAFSTCARTLCSTSPDACADAEAIPTLPAHVVGDTTWATPSAPNPPDCGYMDAAPDVWYTLVGDGYSMTAALCDSPVIWDSQIAVYEGTCDGLICVASADDGCNGCGGCHGAATWDSTAGTTYYVRVWGFTYTNPPTAGPFVLTITSAIPTGACCRGTTCTIETQANCEVDGTYKGDGIDCFPYPCGPTPMAYWYDSTNTDKQGSTGSAWIEYTQPSGPPWVNAWWSNEFDLNRQKRVELAFNVQFAVPGPAPIVAVNYARQDYTEPQYPPPIDSFIERVAVPITVTGDYTFSTLLPFCPTWVSVDVMQIDGGNFTIEGTIVHECLTPPTTGACCLPPQQGHPVIPCVEVTQADCQAQGGVFKGVGSVCNPVPTACYGDADCSGAVNFDDINYFVAALAGGEPGWSGYYQSKHGGTPPPCSFWNCDANGSGRCDTPQAPEVNFDDINPFVAELVTPPACP